MPKRAAEEQYEADGGFVEDAPKSKKSKGAKASSSNGKTSANAKAEMQEGADGEVYWEISSKKRVTVGEFKNATLINIREYFEKDGKSLPGKGTALNTDQLNAFIMILPELEGVLKSKGIDVARPDYSNNPKKSSNNDEEDEEEEEEAVESGADESEEPEPPSKKTKSKLDKFKHKTKKNHEATSDEDED